MSWFRERKCLSNIRLAILVFSLFSIVFRTKENFLQYAENDLYSPAIHRNYISPKLYQTSYVLICLLLKFVNGVY